MGIGDQLRRVRKGLGMTQVEAGRLIGISGVSVSKIEGGVVLPSTNVLSSMCRVYGIPYVILVWMSLDEGDVPEGKVDAFRMVKPSIDALISSVFELNEN